MSEAKRKELSRRERQIMDIIHGFGEATVRRIQGELPDPPTDMAVRRMLHILEDKGHVRRREGQEGREVVYLAAESRLGAGVNALRHVLNTFFSGSMDQALAAHFADGEGVKPEELERIQSLIQKAREEGR